MLADLFTQQSAAPEQSCLNISWEQRGVAIPHCTRSQAAQGSPCGSEVPKIGPKDPLHSKQEDPQWEGFRKGYGHL